MTDQGSQGYAGQEGVADSASPFNAAEFHMAQMLGRVRTAVVVQVKAVANAGGVEPAGLVDVQPLVQQIDGLGNATSHGTIFDIPYQRLQGGRNAVIIDPQVGDIGIMLVCDRDISSVKANKAESTPGSRRRFDLADGIYVGGLLNGTPDQYVAFTAAGIRLADRNGNVIEMKSGGTTVTGNLIVSGNLQLGGAIESVPGSTYGGDIKTTGNVTAGFGGADQVGLQTHKHPANNAPPTPGT